ncbi:MAG: hypothetical protein QM582_07840 [Micropruina sp.]|uniref:hypothetical protein n=1 Tax=Micropruina sp. TaxID=2737536 RepID=UPI0039E703F7
MRLRQVAAPVIGAMMFCASVGLVQPVATADQERQVEFVITDDRIAGSSGLAADPVNQVYWTMNDVGDPGVVYAVDKSGKTVGTLRYDAAPTDVESIAYSDGRLYVGDTGGNREKRPVFTVYEFTRPRPDNSVQPFRALRFSYPDGPHDTEAMLVDSHGRFTFVTKGAEQGLIFTAPAQLSSTEPNPLTQVGEAPQYVTDGTVLADGRMILRNYVAVFRLDPASWQIVAAAGTPPLKQGESVTAPLRGRGLLIGSEGKESEVLRVPVPTTLGRLPTIANSPAVEPSASATPSASPEQHPDSGQTTGLFVYGAGGLLVAAGLATVFLRRRGGRASK